MAKNPWTINPVKLNRPKLKGGLVVRPRLLDRLNQALQTKVALVSAPAGFGKTTLVCQWLQDCPLPNFWVQLDINDSNLPRFLMIFMAAVRQSFPEALLETEDLLAASLPPPYAAWQNALINDLSEMEKTPFVLVLDDYHHLHNLEIDRLLYDVLQYGGNAIHLVIITRRDPGFSFSKLRVNAEMAEIRSGDLRFVQDEVSVFFRNLDQTINETTLQKIYEKVEGWAAGLSMAALNLHESASLDELIARLDGSDRMVSDYLLDEVLSKQPQDVQEFLLKSSVLDRFCASLCQAVLGGQEDEAQIQARLEQIERAQLFLIPLDHSRQWYRYHHLFQQMLFARLKMQCSQDEIRRLHQRAASWLAGENLLEDALKYLVRIGDWVGAACLVEGNLRQQLNTEDFQVIDRQLKLFAPDFIQTRPGLLLMQAWLAHFYLQIPLVFQIINQIQILLDDPQRAQEDQSSNFCVLNRALIGAQIQALKGLVALMRNQGAESIAYIQQALGDIPADWTFVRGNAMLYMGLAMQAEGQDAVGLLELEYQACQQKQEQYGLRLLFSMSACYYLTGNLQRAKQTAEILLQGAEAAQLGTLRGWGHHMLARAYLEWNEVEPAAQHFAAVAQQRFSVNRNCAKDSLAGWAHASRALGQPEEARLALEVYTQFLQGQAELRGDEFSSLYAWNAPLDGDREAARNWAEGEAPPIGGQSRIWLQAAEFYRARILMALNEPDSLQRAGEILEELGRLAEKTHNTPLMIKIYALQSIRLDQLSRRSEAIELLKKAVRMARPGRFVYPFVDLGPPMAELLRSLCRHEQDDDLAGTASMLLSAFERSGAAVAATPNPRLAINILLTNREQEVLRLLTERLSTKEIAERLVISASTVRQHTIHIYQKLGVHNKRQAASLAYDLGWIDQK